MARKKAAPREARDAGDEPAYKIGYGRAPVAHQFRLGNPGRPKGSRNKLGEHLVSALCADFDAFGVDVIQRVREEDPVVYLRIVAGVVPQTIAHEARLDELSDEELAAYLGAIREALGARGAAGERAVAADSGERAQALPAEVI